MSIKKFREDATKLLLARLLKSLESSIAVPDDIPDLSEIDEDWSLYVAMRGEAPGPAEAPPVFEPISGRKPITIRVSNRVLQAFRKRAESTGTAYQTLINRALQEAVDAFDKAAYL